MEGAREGDVGIAEAEVRSHAHASKLAALALDVLSRQAEGRLLFAGRDFVDARAGEYGVERDDAATAGGNLLGILERGPATPFEHALVAAFAVAGFGDRMHLASPEERAGIAARFVRHADFLETATPYAVYPFVVGLLRSDTVAEVRVALEEALLTADRAGDESPRARSVAAARLTALGAAGGGESLLRIASRATDPAVRALANLLGGGATGHEAEAVATLAGRAGRAPNDSLRTLVRVVTGLALLGWVARTVGFLVGLRRVVEVRIVAGALRVRRRTTLLGKTLRETDETWTFNAVAGAARSRRWAALPLLAGLGALAAGVLVGVLVLVDGVRAADPSLLLVGAAVVLSGVLLDLVLDVLAPARASRVAVDVRLLSGRSVRLCAVPLADADRFLSALADRLPR